MKGKFPLIGPGRVQDGFKTLVYRQMRKEGRDQRRLTEQRATKHQLKARKSCVTDARSYRVAREFPLSAVAHLDWKTLIPVHRATIFGKRLA
jgi:hypothetical protein